MADKQEELLKKLDDSSQKNKQAALTDLRMILNEQWTPETQQYVDAALEMAIQLTVQTCLTYHAGARHLDKDFFVRAVREAVREELRDVVREEVRETLKELFADFARTGFLQVPAREADKN